MELLVVMAISIILMGLLLAPVMQSFKITRRAQAMVDSQDAARMALLTISRELGQAMFVYDNASNDVVVDTSDVTQPPSQPRTPIMLPVAQPGGTTTTWFALPGGKIDFILPKLNMHCNNPAHTGGPRDYPRSLEITDNGVTRTEIYAWPDCPYCKKAGIKADDVEARPKLPMEQDVTVVRYFLGLRNNVFGSSGYVTNAGWVSPWGQHVLEGTENQVVLYRAEFSPYDDSLFPAFVAHWTGQQLSDPFFFYRTAPGASGGTCAENWMKIARVVGIGKYEDLITATTNPTSGAITAVEPTVTFRMASVENDTFNPAYTSDRMNDYPNAPATVFSGTYGYWTPDGRVDVFRGNYTDTPPGGVDYYTRTENTGEMLIIKRVPDGSDAWKETVEFSISEYQMSGFVASDAAGSGPLEMAFTIDPNRGTVNFALQPPRENAATSGPVFNTTAYAA